MLSLKGRAIRPRDDVVIIVRRNRLRAATPSSGPVTGRPVTQRAGVEQVEHPLRADARKQRGRHPEHHGGQVLRVVRVGPDRDAHRSVTRDREQVHVEVVTVGMGVDLNGLVQLGHLAQDALISIP